MSILCNLDMRVILFERIFMSIAELHGKLSPETAHDRMEDILTSDVFGTMYYAGFDSGFVDWLLESKPTDSTVPTIHQFLGASPLHDISFSFWPRLPNGREPDLALLFASEDGSQHVLLIEVKYLSGMSNLSLEVADNDSGVRELTGNQIIDQMVGFSVASQGTADNWFGLCATSDRMPFAHLLVTTDAQLPRHVYAEACQSCKHKGMSGFPCPTYWLSWRSLVRNIEPHINSDNVYRSRLISDLVRLLERKELTDKPFEAFHKLEWIGPLPEGGFWRWGSLFSDLASVQLPSLGWTDDQTYVFWRGNDD